MSKEKEPARCVARRAPDLRVCHERRKELM